MLQHEWWTKPEIHLTYKNISNIYCHTSATFSIDDAPSLLLYSVQHGQYPMIQKLHASASASNRKCSLPSDKALADRMGVTRQVLWQARNERGQLSDERIAQLCAMAKLDGPAWIAKIHAERAESPTERAMWKVMLERLSTAAALGIIGLGVTSLTYQRRRIM